jgi:hypothetical protein
MSTQFVRVEPVSFLRAAGIVGEADRQPEYCSHVAEPRRAHWLDGSSEAVHASMREVMATPCAVRGQDGKVRQRKRRSDFRCLLAGVISWPISVQELKAIDPERKHQERLRLKGYMDDSRAWLHRNYGKQLMGTVIHTDETYPHLHFFVVGNCLELHPGLRAEYENGVRIASRREKEKRYASAMRQWLDEHHAEVAAKYGLARAEPERRRIGKRLKARIKDQALASRLADLERRIQSAEDLAALEQLVADARLRQLHRH